ncbi:MAG: general stress protein CsbD [Bacteroidia bacterium]|nr:general stress protein CsbD [Bacteroidia bacterium]
MNIVRSWREQKIMLKRRFPILSDNDFVSEDGSKESVLKILEIKLSKTRTELESLLAELQLY